MKLSEIEGSSPQRLADEEMKFAYDIIKDGTMTISELTKQTRQLARDFVRGRNSLNQLVVRMYLALYGDAPVNMTDNIGWYADRPGRIIDYLERNGHSNAKENWNKAEHNARIRAAKPVIKPEQAKKMMSDYVKANRDIINIAAATPEREDIISKIIDGLTAEEAFANYLK